VDGPDLTRSEALLERAIEINRKSGQRCGQAIPDEAAEGLLAAIQPVKVSAVAPLESQRHSGIQLRRALFDRVSQLGARRQR
jgi:hypothetical protein